MSYLVKLFAIDEIVIKSYLNQFTSTLKLISTMAIAQGKNDRTFLYWNDKNIKREKLFQLLSSFHSSG